MMWIISPLPSPQQLRGQKTSVGIELIELIEPSDASNYKQFYKHCFYKLCNTYFYCSYLCGTKSFFLKAEPYFTFA